jgi:hypothetical protein
MTDTNCHDSTQALPLLDAIPGLQGLLDRPRFRPDCIVGDRAYDAEKLRRALRAVTSRRYSQCAIRKTAAVWDDSAGS